MRCEDCNLKQELEKLKNKYRELQIEHEKLHKEFEEYKAKYPASDFIPDTIKSPVTHRHKKCGQKKGHMGYSRKIPERIDIVKSLTIDVCPECGGKLSEVQEIRKRYVEDIPPVSNTIVTEYEIERRYCINCKKIVEPEVVDALPNARFGLNLMSIVVYLRECLALPVEKITALLEAQYNLVVSEGEVIKILKQMNDALGPYYERLKKKIKEARVKHADETSWRVNGKNYWLWTLVNKEVVLYLISKKRNYKVPEKVLGNQNGKIVVSDRAPLYNTLEESTGCMQQKSWSHILEDSRDLADHYKEAKPIHKELKGIYHEAKSYNHQATQEQLYHLLRRIDRIAEKTYQHSEVRKFVKSVCVKHRENLFRFVMDPEVDSTNNRAERALRKGVIIRKISNGSRSRKGARLLEVLLSVVETLKLQCGNILQAIRNLVLTSKA